MLANRVPLLLIAAVCLATWAPPARAAQVAPRPEPHETAVRFAPPALSSPAHARPTRFSRLAPWRYRLKSVLEESAIRAPEQVDLGPATSPDHNIVPFRSVSRRSYSSAMNPLRC
jgi:hypothetical protein